MKLIELIIELIHQLAVYSEVSHQSKQL